MLQVPRKARADRSQKSYSRPIPPPVGGWNARDSLASMKPQDAVILENFFPKQSEVVTRGGYALHCDTSEGAYNVETLAEYKSGTTRKLIAGCHGKLIDVTSSSPSTIGSGFTNNRWKWVNFGGKIFLVNGTDAPQDWDGTTLTSTAWSGLTIANLSDVCVFKERMFFIEKNTQSFWYASATKVITGALTKFDLRYVGNFGGTLQAIGTITADGGSGVDDLLALYFSSGEVVIYSGSDPGDAANWALVGRFNIGAPVGAALVQFGSDLIAITQGAYVPLTKVLSFGRTNPSSLDLSDKISGEVARVTKTYSGNSGWQAILYPAGRMLLFNVPRSSISFDQHVMNIDTKAWCKFTNWNFPIFGTFNDALYAGGQDGKVYRVDYGYDDNDEPIVVDAQTAWNYFGMPNQEKVFSMSRIIFKCVTDPYASMSIGTDFEIAIPADTIQMEEQGSLGAVWDVGVWDVATWSGSDRILKGWNGCSGVGYCASLRIRFSVETQSVSWQSANIVFEPAGLV